MHELINGQIVDDQTFEQEIELKEVEAVEQEVYQLTYDTTEREWQKMMQMTASDFINLK